MTDQKTQKLPAEMQGDTARDDEKEIVLTPEDEADLEESLAAADRGEFATDAEIDAVHAKYLQPGSA